MIDPVRLQIAVSNSSRRSSRRSDIACSIPNHAWASQAPPILPHSRLQNPRKTLPTELVHITTSSLSLNLEVPLALQNP